MRGKDWQLYDVMNKFEKCTPSTPLGKCSEITMDEVFVQGSTDAVLMAWNTMDSRNKRKDDRFDTEFVIEGISLKGITFVDDIVEFIRREEEIIDHLVDDDVFQCSNRLRFKSVKCKILPINSGADNLKEVFVLNGELLELVLQHKYLGTIIERYGRKADFEERVKIARGVVNEIVQICKSFQISTIRLKYVNMLLEACLSSTVKYGCEIWDDLSEDEAKRIDDLKVNLIKRVMELPYSTPSAAIKYEFGLVDYSLEVQMEKVLLAVKTLKSDENRVAKQLLQAHLRKNIPGFSRQVVNICMTVFGCQLETLVSMEGDVRSVLREAYWFAR